jgi:hypothetical protein
VLIRVLELARGTTRTFGARTNVAVAFSSDGLVVSRYTGGRWTISTVPLRRSA